MQLPLISMHERTFGLHKLYLEVCYKIKVKDWNTSELNETIGKYH